MQELGVKLLLVDDEAAMRRVIRASLEPRGYSIDEAESGESAISAIERNGSGMVLLDINMPGMGGIEACRAIRRVAPNSGIIMISVLGREDDKITALEAGADDYVTKPFRMRELLARLHAVYRRTIGVSGTPTEVFRAGELELDIETRQLKKAGSRIHLSVKEFEIMAFFMRHPNTSIPHARLLKAVWGPEYGGETEYLRTYIRNLRRKIESSAARPEYIVTEPWLGYRFQQAPEGSPDSCARD